MKKFIKPAGYIITLLAFAFIFKTLLSASINYSRIISWKELVLVGLVSTLLYGGSNFVLAFAWKKILQFAAGKKISAIDATHAYIRSAIVKYLPGNVMQYAGRNLLGGQLGLKQMDIAVSSVFEIVCLLVTSFFITVLFSVDQLSYLFRNLVMERVEQVKRPVWIAGILILAILLLGSVWLFKKKRETLQPYKRFFTRDFLFLLLRMIPIYAAVLLTAGFVLTITLKYVLGCSVGSRVFVTLAYFVIAWLLGFITPGAPGGIGVRETALLFLLGPFWGVELTALAALLQRLFSILGDVLAFVLQVIVEKVRGYSPDGQVASMGDQFDSDRGDRYRLGKEEEKHP